MIETIYSNPNELYHHGVKGMKWGVRRFQNKDGSLTNAGKRHARLAVKSVANAGKQNFINSKHETYKRSKTMTDDELKAATKRLNAERSYRQAVANDKKDSHLIATSTLLKIGGIAAGTVIASAGKDLGQAAVKKILGK